MGKKEEKSIREVRAVLARYIKRGQKRGVKKFHSNVKEQEKSEEISETGEKLKFSKGTILKLHKVTKRFGNHEVLKNVNFEVNQGDLFGIIGLSGSGKTTLLNLIIGFIEPDEGEILVNLFEGDEFCLLSDSRHEICKYFGFASQNTSFYKKLTAQENLVHFAALYGIFNDKAKDRARKLLDLMELKDAKDTIADQLSGGMQKRLDIACSLIHSPKVLILDEPTADLDPLLRTEILDLVKKINKDGTTVIIASHFLREIEHLCTRMAILHHKEVKAISKAESLKTDLGKFFRKIVKK